MITKFLVPRSAAILLLPALAQAADITGIPKIRDGDQIQIGTSRIRLGGIDAPIGGPVVPQQQRRALDLRRGSARRTHQACREQVLDLPCAPATDRRGRLVARCEVDGEDIQKWLVKSGWALSYVRFSHDYDADEKAAREAKAGMWQGAFIAPWDWRVRNKKTVILGAAKAARKRQRDPAGVGLRIGGALARLHDQGQRQPIRRMHLSQADQPLVRANRNEDQQGHALVLLGRRRRSRRLPRDQTLVPCYGRRAKRRDRLADLTERALLLALLLVGVYTLTGLSGAAGFVEITTSTRKASPTLPMVTHTAQGIPGDPINVGLVGNDKDVLCAMQAAGWYPADPVTLRSSIEIAGSVLLDRPYRDAPVSNLYYLGRREDLAFEKPDGRSADHRHHVRFWKALDEGEEKRPVWLGAVDLRPQRRRQPLYRRHHPPYRCRSRRRAKAARRRPRSRTAWWTPNTR